MTGTELEEMKSYIDSKFEEHESHMTDFLMSRFIKKVNAAFKDIFRLLHNERLNSAEMASMLGISIKALQKRCERGNIPFHKDSEGRLYFLRKEINHLIHGRHESDLC